MANIGTRDIYGLPHQMSCLYIEEKLYCITLNFESLDEILCVIHLHFVALCSCLFDLPTVIAVKM